MSNTKTVEQVLKEALEIIAAPISYLRKQAEKDGGQLNGQYALVPAAETPSLPSQPTDNSFEEEALKLYPDLTIDINNTQHYKRIGYIRGRQESGTKPSTTSLERDRLAIDFAENITKDGWEQSIINRKKWAKFDSDGKLLETKTTVELFEIFLSGSKSY